MYIDLDEVEMAFVRELMQYIITLSITYRH